MAHRWAPIATRVCLSIYERFLGTGAPEYLIVSSFSFLDTLLLSLGLDRVEDGWGIALHSVGFLGAGVAGWVLETGTLLT